MVLDSLSPAERVALVLHDVFALPFSEVGSVLGRSTDATKMLASRARRKVRGHDGVADDQHLRRRVVDAFRAAARDGDIDALLRVLDPEVQLRVDSPAGRVQVEGAEEVARRASYFAARSGPTTDVVVAGRSGVLARDHQGAAVSLLVFDVEGQQIITIDALTDPSTLTHMSLPL
ncbi:sigma factor-like helix-turn-helix DNA-binding protein [Nocardioides aurantiacus]|uniref:sigma factor-like helix-turn-helix DNA-binding protein n=1 Tax=Nocardioides aurantiacus TaxID=86796 RepID=UPI001B875AE8|nr:sigma factor-like helix-turn-helix DNA-binding protein [Nocardioides aurantiacus]